MKNRLRAWPNRAEGPRKRAPGIDGPADDRETKCRPISCTATRWRAQPEHLGGEAARGRKRGEELRPQAAGGTGSGEVSVLGKNCTPLALNGKWSGEGGEVQKTFKVLSNSRILSF